MKSSPPKLGWGQPSPYPVRREGVVCEEGDAAVAKEK